MKYEVARTVVFAEHGSHIALEKGTIVTAVRLEDIEDGWERAGCRRCIQGYQSQGKQAVVFLWRGKHRTGVVGEDLKSAEEGTRRRWRKR